MALLPLLAALSVRLWLDPERLRQRVEQGARQQLGLPLTLHDRLYWSWWPLFAIEAGGGGISTADGQPLLSWRRLQIGARWRDLLGDDLVIDSIRVDGLVAQLQRDAQGRGNWQLLFNRPRGSGRLQIRQLRLTDGSIGFVDLGTARSWAATNVNADCRLDVNPATAALMFTEPRISASISGSGLSAGATPLTISTARLLINTTENSVAAAPLQLRYANLDLNVTLGGSLHLAPLQGAGTLQLSSDSLRRSLPAFGVAVPPTRDAAVLGQARVTTQWRADAEALGFSELHLQLDATAAQGAIRWPLAAGGVPEFELRGDRLDADRYLPPVGRSQAPVELPMKQLQAVKIRGTLQLDSLTLRGVTARGARIRIEE
jgi:AsmA protein